MDALRARGEEMDAEARSAFVQPILDRYEEESDAAYSTARLWDDGIIDPRDTRRALALGLAAAARAPIPEPRFGVFRM
jgi:acetyl-CoA carboxylase carboxyltransferase component